MAISPNTEPFLSTASASSPLPGILRLMRTSPSAMMYSRLPGLALLEDRLRALTNFCS